MKTLPAGSIGYGFIADDEYRFRFRQVPDEGFRNLTEDETETLRRNGCRCSRWSDVRVMDPFDPETIIRCSFYGLVRIGSMQQSVLCFHDFMVEEGITDSRIISCDIGSHCAIHDVAYLSHYIIGTGCILSRIDEMQCTNHSKFGVGIVKEGEDESVRIRLDLMNEAGGREVLPFETMNSADAYLWARKRDRKVLMERFLTFTGKTETPLRGVYGTVARDCVIKSCRIIKDVRFGECCYVKGCNKLKNLTVRSSEDEPTQLGEGIELVNGIVGRGCRIFYGVKAIRFVFGSHCSMKYGARVIHSMIGANSTISCCEVLNNLIFPFHEEHHNNSFLIASIVMGQSNMAAGAIVGSNHNTRANDGELAAGRGFWPALSSTVKHDSRFASFVLLAKGNYPSELDIKLPFSLVCPDPASGGRAVMPAYWWMYNMYALFRNSDKFRRRDLRKVRNLNLVIDFLAPDTVCEIFRAIELIETWIVMDTGCEDPVSFLLSGMPLRTIHARDMENSDIPMTLLKPSRGYQAYWEMLTFYCMSVLTRWCRTGHESPESVLTRCSGDHLASWENVGGQIMPDFRVEALISDIENGIIDSWDMVHERYRQIASSFDEDELECAVYTYRRVCETFSLDWDGMCARASEICDRMRTEIWASKQKDYDNPYRKITYMNADERNAVLGEKLVSIPFEMPSFEAVSFDCT